MKVRVLLLLLLLCVCVCVCFVCVVCVRARFAQEKLEAKLAKRFDLDGNNTVEKVRWPPVRAPVPPVAHTCTRQRWPPFVSVCMLIS